MHISGKEGELEKRGEGIYLYCFARSDLIRSIDGKGVDGSNPLFLWNFQDIAAVLSVVSLEEFCGPSAEFRMEDLSWIGPRSLRHEEVIDGVMRYSPVLPARLGTIFSSLESLQELLQKHRITISQFLDHVADKEEWAVKGWLDRPRAGEWVLSTSFAKQMEGLASLSPGMRYLKEQRIRADMEKELDHWLKEVLGRIARHLSGYASNFSQRNTFSMGAQENEMIINWAFLVMSDEAEDFRRRIELINEKFAPSGLALEITGPWPPYSFSPSLERGAGE